MKLSELKDIISDPSKCRMPNTARDDVIYLIERREKKKPKERNLYTDFGIYKTQKECPVCGCIVFQFAKKNNFCNICGQGIDWD